MKGCVKWFGLMTAIAVGIVLALVIVIVSCSYAVVKGLDNIDATRTAVARGASSSSPPSTATTPLPSPSATPNAQATLNADFQRLATVGAVSRAATATVIEQEFRRQFATPAP